MRSPALELVEVALVEDSEDFFRMTSLQVTWRTDGEAEITNWYWDALMKRASGRFTKAAELACDDLTEREPSA
jgi:hypothetical protein